MELLSIMDQKDQITVMIVDDHPIVRQGVSAMIESETDMVIVAAAQNGMEAINFFSKYAPDVTLMDLRLPEMDGVETIIAIREKHPEAKIIVLSSYGGDEDINRALRAGAKAYLLKETRPKEIAKAIRLVHAGKKYIPAEIADRLASRTPLSCLSYREIEILQLLAKGLSGLQIAESLDISINTVKTHIKNIHSKLDAKDRSQALLTAIQRGIIHLG
jgi:two-component system, NarL family, response regulator